MRKVHIIFLKKKYCSPINDSLRYLLKYHILGKVLICADQIMTAKVRIFYHQGIVTAPLMGGGAAFSAESSQLLDQPYLDSEVLICDTKKAQSTSGDRAGPAARLVRIEVQPGKSIYYEINPPNRSVKASDHSPLLSGAATYPFGGGLTISVLEATAA